MAAVDPVLGGLADAFPPPAPAARPGTSGVSAGVREAVDTDGRLVAVAGSVRSSVPNCPEVATNVPGVVAFRDSADPETVVTMTPESWAMFTDAVKAGEYDISA